MHIKFSNRSGSTNFRPPNLFLAGMALHDKVSMVFQAVEQIFFFMYNDNKSEEISFLFPFLFFWGSSNTNQGRAKFKLRTSDLLVLDIRINISVSSFIKNHVPLIGSATVLPFTDPAKHAITLFSYPGRWDEINPLKKCPHLPT